MERNDVRWIIAVTAVVVALFGSAWITSNVMITLAGVVCEDLHELRDTIERVRLDKSNASVLSSHASGGAISSDSA